MSGRRAVPWIGVGALVGLLMVVDHALSPDSLAFTPTSHGKIPGGFGALHDLLHELRLSRGRTRRGPSRVAPREARWLLSPHFLRARVEGDQPAWSTAAQDAQAAELGRWVAEGGVAVIFGGSDSDWSRVGLSLEVLPGDLDPSADGQASPSGHESREKSPSADWEPSGNPATRLRDAVLQLAPTARARSLAESMPGRAIELHGLVRFESVDQSQARVMLEVDGYPLVVETIVGAGRLVAVADARIVANDGFDRADHSLLAVDLVRAYGEPVFDERCHGLSPVDSLWAALGWRRGSTLIVGFGLLGLLALWSLRTEPPRTLVDEAPFRPSLDAYVNSLAQRYGRGASRDAAAVFEAYRTGMRHRLRRVLFGHRQGTDAQLARRISADLANDTRSRQAIEGTTRPRNVVQLREAVRDLEGYLARTLRATNRGADSSG